MLDKTNNRLQDQMSQIFEKADLTGFECPEARADLMKLERTPSTQDSYTSEQRRDAWQKLLETDGCLGSWSKETGEWIPLLR